MTIRPAKIQKRERILEAAKQLFRAYGLRGTSMEAIAKEAGMAKGTVYAQFADKESAFLAVCEAMAAKFIRDAESAAKARATRGSTGVGREQIVQVLLAKFGLVHELVYNSAHATEILEGSNKHANEVFERADAAYLKILALVLHAGHEGEHLTLPPSMSAKEVARLLFYSAEGITRRAESRSELERFLRRLVAGMLDPRE
jgi:AcrR family transcriptional regulator